MKEERGDVMKAISVLWLTLMLVGGCAASPAYFYPGNHPKECKVSDGYCYHRFIENDKLWVDVYIFSPKYGWKFHHREPAS